MKRKSFKIIHYVLLFVLLIFVWAAMGIPAMGEWYAYSVYPSIAKVLSSISGRIPFSVGDLFIFLSIAGLVIYPFVAGYRKKKWEKIILNMVTYLALVYVWFYLAWGLNYSQPDFYRRTNIAYSRYSPEKFQSFAEEYIANLNQAYIPIHSLDKTMIHADIINTYRSLDGVGIHHPRGNPRVKTMLLSPLISKMGISGYMGPFFCEFNVNADLPLSQYPSTYAHELAHFLGITGEAEANFYAYLVCTCSDVPEIRFCGYFSVLHYVLDNARGFMSEEKYMRLIAGIRSEIVDLATENRKHWQALYSPVAGEVQSWFYDLYLKGNKIQSGRKNYSEVVGLLISWREHE